jgi:hypothetical protein
VVIGSLGTPLDLQAVLGGQAAAVCGLEAVEDREVGGGLSVERVVPR